MFRAVRTWVGTAPVDVAKIQCAEILELRQVDNLLHVA
jgi:hypothetical protein